MRRTVARPVRVLRYLPDSRSCGSRKISRAYRIRKMCRVRVTESRRGADVKPYGPGPNADTGRSVRYVGNQMKRRRVRDSAQLCPKRAAWGVTRHVRIFPSMILSLLLTPGQINILGARQQATNEKDSKSVPSKLACYDNRFEPATNPLPTTRSGLSKEKAGRQRETRHVLGT
jgi:hypothetical protein